MGWSSTVPPTSNLQDLALTLNSQEGERRRVIQQREEMVVNHKDARASCMKMRVGGCSTSNLDNGWHGGCFCCCFFGVNIWKPGTFYELVSVQFPKSSKLQEISTTSYILFTGWTTKHHNYIHLEYTEIHLRALVQNAYTETIHGSNPKSSVY